MSEQKTADLQVDIVSDVVCPWCIVGYKQLEKALASAGVSAEIVWHPFELNPQMGTAGQNLREHISEKYGTTAEQSAQARDRLAALGTELGFPFNFGEDMRMYNTFRSHQLLHWAGTQGRQHDLKMQLFSAFFTHQQNVDDPDTLADAAEEVGLDRNEALAILADGRFADQVRQAEQFWTSRGIQGVPAMIFNQRHLVSGAQGVENYISVLRQLTEGRAA